MPAVRNTNRVRHSPFPPLPSFPPVHLTTNTTTTTTVINNNIANAIITTAAHTNVTTTTNNTISNDSEECWNEYCWDEAEYRAAVEDHIFPQNYEWFFICLYTLTFLVGLVGNTLVCFAVWRNLNMRSVTNVFLVNLAVGDLLVLLLCLPPTLVQNVSLTWFLGSTMCKTLLFLQVYH